MIRKRREIRCNGLTAFPLAKARRASGSFFSSSVEASVDLRARLFLKKNYSLRFLDHKAAARFAAGEMEFSRLI
jgi:hypothetical protein